MAVVKQNSGTFKVGSLLEKVAEEVEVGSLSEVEKGSRFCNWILKYMFERTEDEIDIFTEVAGKDDNSVDAWYEENKTLYIIQAKYKTAHNWKAVAEFIKNMEKLLTEPFKLVGSNDKLYDLAYKIEEFNEEHKDIELYYITNSYLTDSEVKKIDFAKESFENNFSNAKLNIFGVNEIKDFLEMELNALPARYRGKEALLILKNKFVSGITCLAEVALKDFAEFVSANRDYLFYSNVRNYLRSTNVNKAISDTFRQKPTDFWYYNNGVTIVCDEFTPNKTADFLLNITTPQIVNGCQTANTILNEYKKLDKDARKNLQGTILVKIIQDPNDLKRDNITRYTNNQNSVSGKDFYALDDFQKKLKKDFKELGYYYEIQRKSSLALQPWELKNYKGHKTYEYLFPPNFSNVLPVKEVVQAFAAGMHLMPSTAASRSGELAPYGEQWSKLFNNNTPEDTFHFLYPYATMQYAKSYLGYDSKKGSGFRKNCLMLFVTTYFKLLVYLLMEIGNYDKFANVNPLDIELVVIRRIFESEDINKFLLKLTDKTLEFYMRDNTVKSLQDNNLPKFLKSTIQTNKTALEVMANQIKDTISELSSQELGKIRGVIEQD